jgi:hypothetical protein
MSSSLFDSLARGLSALLDTVERAGDNPASLNRLLAPIGVMPDADSRALVDGLAAVVRLKKQVKSLAAQATPSFGRIAALLDASADAFEALQQLERAGGALSELEGLGQDLVTLLVIAYMESRAPALRPAAALLTLIEPAEEQQGHPPVVRDGRLLREPYRLDRFRVDRLPKLLRDPVPTLRAEYGNPLATAQDSQAMADKLFPRLLRLFRSLGVSCRYGYDPADEAFLGDAAPLMAHALIIYSDDPLNAAADEAGLVLSLSSAEQGDLGLVISPFGTLSSQWPAGRWMIVLDLTAGVDLLAWGRHGLTLLAGVGTVEVRGSISATLAAPDEGPPFIFGVPSGSRLEVRGAQLSAETTLSQKRQTVALSAAVASAALIIAPGDADSFLSSSLPAKGLRADFDLGLAWSNERGFSLSGNAGLKATLPVGLSIGGVSVPTVHLGLHANDADVGAEVSASVGLSIGPVHALVDRVGIRTLMSFPEKGGNLGVVDLEIGFKPPSGVGIKVDSPFVTGGGFLSFEKDQYAGAMLLNIEGGITVTAIGVIATKLPNHAKGFSFVVMITAQGFKPIPLGLGFTLTAIGGLLAINRTCNEEFLREGIQNNTLNHLLFPKDPIRNAPQIFGTLNKAFPPSIGSYLFGPVVQICWGTPPVLTMDLGLVLELGNKRRLIILGRVSAILPSEKHDLIRLQMNALGIIDFDQKSISLDAVLYDSRLVGKFPITGSMAMRLRWGSAPIFALSIGGFHPAFKPPPAFPVLKRLAISLSDTENFRLRIECYLAITSNTLQFGAKVELMARAGRFSIEGRLSFDVLIQFDPFFFQADFQARVQLKFHSHNLFSVDVKGQLLGPRPLHIKGKATFGIWWCHFSVRFDKTLVEGERPPQLEAINVLEQLIVALKDSRNWSGQLAEGERRAVILRELEGTVQVVLHPLDRLSVKQNVVPLELEISKFGNTTPAGARLFTINRLTLDGNVTQFSRVKDFFAPAQFLDLSEDEKLAAPSFEAMTAGIIVGAEGFLFTNNADILKDSNILEDDKISYETIIVDREFEAENPEPRKSTELFFINADFLDRNISLGAAARSDIRRTGSAKYRFQPTGDESQSRPPAGKNLLDKKGWTIASTEDGSHQGAPGLEAGKVVSYSESFQALQRLKRENPAKAKTLMLIRVSVN